MFVCHRTCVCQGRGGLSICGERWVWCVWGDGEGGSLCWGVEGGDYDYEAVCFSWLMMCAL